MKNTVQNNTVTNKLYSQNFIISNAFETISSQYERLGIKNVESGMHFSSPLNLLTVVFLVLVN
jgi:hypothetical protein